MSVLEICSALLWGCVIIALIIFVVSGCDDCGNLSHCESYQLGSGCNCCVCAPYLERMIHINGRYYYSSITEYVYIRENKPIVVGKSVSINGSFEQVIDDDGTALTYGEYLSKYN